MDGDEKSSDERNVAHRVVYEGRGIVSMQIYTKYPN